MVKLQEIALIEIREDADNPSRRSTTVVMKLI
jgi:hypothetical protein